MAPHSNHRRHAGSIEVDYLPIAELQDNGSIRSERLLALVRYGMHAQEVLPVDRPMALIPTPALNGQNLVEAWISSTPVTVGRRGGIHFAVNGQALFGVHRLEEADTSLDNLAYTAYSDIARLVQDEGYGHLLRMWNYFGDINKEQEDLERYRRFCVGRYHAFAELGSEFAATLPAASVVGTGEPGLIIYFLAAREVGTPVENPRQVSAYRYPLQYSPRSPSFSRAMVKDWGMQSHLYISGTASIVGHRTCHAGNVQQQLAEIVRNIRALLKQTIHETGIDFQGSSSKSLFKVYVRDVDNLAVVREALLAELGEALLVLYLRGDPCRRDLLLEVEGIYAR